MNRDDFKTLSIIRLKEARILFNNHCYEGSYYLAGYAIECALKACIAKNVRKYDFPEKNYERKLYTHDLAQLIKSAGLWASFDQMNQIPEFSANWAVVKDWSGEKRYEKTIPQTTARDLLDAITTKQYGVLKWLKMCW